MRDVPWEDVFKLGASAAVTEICELVQVGINVYIPRSKQLVKPGHSTPWFSVACAAAIAHKNHLFRLYQQNKSSSREVSNFPKRVLEAV